MVELWEHKSGKAIKAHVISVQVNGQVYRLSAPKSASPAIATTAKRRQKPAGVTAAAVSGSESVKQCLVLKVFLLLARQQPSCCLPLAQLLDQLSQLGSSSSSSIGDLIEMCLEQAAQLFQLQQDTRGELVAQLKLPLGWRALVQLLRLDPAVQVVNSSVGLLTHQLRTIN
jgi:hypothetical protein